MQSEEVIDRLLRIRIHEERHANLLNCEAISTAIQIVREYANDVKVNNKTKGGQIA